MAKYNIQVEAWRHKLGEGKLTARSGPGELMQANEGDWIVRFKDGSHVAFPNEQFHATFIEDPSNAN